MPQGFGGQGTVRSVTGFGIRSVLLNHGLLRDVAEAVVLIERLDAAGVVVLLIVRRSTRSTLFTYPTLFRCIVDHMLGGVVLAGDAVAVDVARAIGVAEGFGGQGTVRSVTGLD